MKYLIPILFLCSCSASYHIKRAVKKDPTIQKEIVDTLQIVNVTTDTIYNSDSTYYLKHTFDTTIRTYSYQKYDFSEFKTWYQTLQENKTERVRIRTEGKTDRVNERQTARTDRSDIRNERKKHKRGGWLWWVGVILFFLIVILVMIILGIKWIKK